jgi:hypothetical protein
VYPLLVAAMFKLFGALTAPAFFASVALNILFSSGACVPIFYSGKRIGGLGVASGGAWLWALFPNGVLMPFEWIWDTSLSALLAATLLWATLALAESERFRDWCVYGLLWGLALMTNPALGALLPFLVGWGGWAAPQLRRTPVSVEESRCGSEYRCFVLRAVDDSQLCCLSSDCSIAIEFAV